MKSPPPGRRAASRGRRVRKTVPEAGRRAPPPRSSARGNVYLYGIVRWPAPGDLASLGAGVGDPPRPIRAVSYRNIAALVSGVFEAEISQQDVRGTRRDMKAHAAVLNRAIGSMTILPVRFGVVLPSADALITRLLQPQHPEIQASLDRLDGTLEVTLRATFVEEQVLREVVHDQPDLAGRSAAGYQARIEIGKRIAAAIQQLRDREARALVRRLSPFVRDYRPGQPLNELMALNASFLVDRATLPDFDRELAAIHTEARHRLQLDCVGPLPPYSFVDLRL